jgi:periplasmic divalent cation tolerance protein
MDAIVRVTITAPDADWLAEFTRTLLDDRLAASGNITSEVRSIYRWQGKIEDAAEAMVTLSTCREHVPEIIKRTLAEHPYEIPHVVALPVLDANSAYRQWVIDETRPTSQSGARPRRASAE